MIFSSMDRRRVSLVEVLGSTIGCSKRKASRSSKHDEGNGTHTTLKPTEDRLTGSVVLALMNWTSKGDREPPLTPKGVVQVRVCERGTMVRTKARRETLRFADSRSVLTNTGE